MSLISRLFGRDDRDATAPLYNRIVTLARAEHWYREGRVPDTVDGRFDMVAAILALVLVRMENDPVAGPEPSARLAERFVEDMDEQLRQIGIGDMTVGRHVGNMMSMLGGRLGAYRDGFVGGDIDGAITRNLFRGVAPDPAALAHVRKELTDLRERLSAVLVPALVEGQLA